MKKFLLFIILFLMPSYSIAYEIDKIKVIFNTKVDSKFIQKISKITFTQAIKLNDYEYEFKINRIITKDILDKYSEFFSIVKNVKEVSPLPSIKSYDNINSNIYIRNDLPKYNNENKNINEEDKNTNEITETSDLFSQPINKEYNLKFKENVNNEYIENLELLSGAKFKYDDKEKVYKVNITEETDIDYTLSVLKNNELVNSFEPVENKNSINETNNQKNIELNNNNNNNLTNYLNSGIMTNIPINYQKDIRISFETDKENDIKWLIEQLNGKIISKKGFNTFIVRFSNNVNPYLAIRAIKVCSGVLSAQLSSSN